MPVRNPPEYKAPLRSRGDICAWLLSRGKGWNCRGGADYEGHPWLFCFDVKLGRLDLDFDHLLQRYIDSGYVPQEMAKDTAWIAGCRDIYNARFGTEQDRNYLYEWSTDLARQTFVGGSGDGRPADDNWTQLWDRTPVNVKFSFMGRSGGWLVLREFEGVELVADGDLAEQMRKEACLELRPGDDRLDSRWLGKLYRYIIQLSHGLAGNAAEEEVEYSAAAILFQHICGDVHSVVWDRAMRLVRRKQQEAFIDQLLGIGPRRLGGTGDQADVSDIVRPKRRIEKPRRPHGESQGQSPPA